LSDPSDERSRGWESLSDPSDERSRGWESLSDPSDGDSRGCDGTLRAKKGTQKVLKVHLTPQMEIPGVVTVL